MLKKKSIIITLSTSIIAFNAEIALAADDSITSSLPPIWPLLAFIIFVVIFRKQLNCVSAVDLNENPDLSKEITEEEEEEEETPEETTTEEITTRDIDLKEGSEQCQARTAKGTRCKRKTNLEETSLTINDKTYQLMVCKQHNIDSLKPFSDLLKQPIIG